MATKPELKIVPKAPSTESRQGPASVFGDTDMLTALQLINDLSDIIPRALIPDFVGNIVKVKSNEPFQSEDGIKSDDPVVMITALRGKIECGRFLDESETIFDTYATVAMKGGDGVNLDKIILSPDVSIMPFSVRKTEDCNVAWVLVVRRKQFLTLLQKKPDNIDGFESSAEKLFKLIGIKRAETSDKRFDVFVLQRVFENVLYKKIYESSVTKDVDLATIQFFMAEMLGTLTRYRQFLIDNEKIEGDQDVAAKTKAEKKVWARLSVFQDFMDVLVGLKKK